MERRLSTREFKLEAARLIIKECGVSYAQASEDLGVHAPKVSFCLASMSVVRASCPT
jgi:hypothetical protein